MGTRTRIVRRAKTEGRFEPMAKTQLHEADWPNSGWSPPGTGGWLLLSTGALLATVAAMLYPFSFKVPGSDVWLDLESRTWLLVLGNVTLFLPVGVSEGCLAQRVFGRRSWVPLMVMADVALLSLFGETAQVWLAGRDSSGVDFVANALGGAVGSWVGPVLLRGP